MIFPTYKTPQSSIYLLGSSDKLHFAALHGNPVCLEIKSGKSGYQKQRRSQQPSTESDSLERTEKKEKRDL